MAGYDNIIGRADVTDAMVPDQEINEIMADAPAQSVMLARARRVPMSARKAKQPVLASLPDAYWVNGDTGLKQTTKATWTGIFITAEELATIVPIPDAFVADATIPLWNQVRPLLTEAIGKKIDEAALFGTDKPESWPTALIPGAIASGNTLAVGTGADFGADVAALAEKTSVGGTSVNGFASRPGLQWKLVGLRDSTGQPVYTQGIAGQSPNGLYGFPLNEVTNGAWDSSAAELLAADWNKVVVGVRQDVTYDMFSEGVISDDSGAVVYNLMQQDMKALRVVMRVGFQVATPLSRQTGENPYPAGVLTPSGSSEGGGE